MVDLRDEVCEDVWMEEPSKEPTDAEDDNEVECPICRYSLVGLEALVCPECGVQIDNDLAAIIQNHDSIKLTRNWAIAGIFAWLVVGIVIWLFGALSIGFRSTYGGIQPTSYDIAGMWLRVLIIIAPIALLIDWTRSSRCRLYERMLKNPACKPKPLARVIFVAMIAIAIDSCLVLLILSAAV